MKKIIAIALTSAFIFSCSKQEDKKPSLPPEKPVVKPEKIKSENKKPVINPKPKTFEEMTREEKLLDMARETKAWLKVTNSIKNGKEALAAYPRIKRKDFQKYTELIVPRAEDLGKNFTDYFQHNNEYTSFGIHYYLNKKLVATIDFKHGPSTYEYFRRRGNDLKRMTYKEVQEKAFFSKIRDGKITPQLIQNKYQAKPTKNANRTAVIYLENWEINFAAFDPETWDTNKELEKKIMDNVHIDDLEKYLNF